MSGLGRITSKRILAAVVAAVLVLSMMPVTAGSAATSGISPFGMCSHMLWGYSRTDIDRELDAMSAAGGHWLRIDVSWRDFETTNGTYNPQLLASLDYIASAAAQRGIGVQAVVMEFPDWSNGGRGMWVPPTDDNEFTQFMQYMAGRYSGRVNYWELGNEVNETEFWAVDRAASPARYAQFLQKGYAGVKAGNPNAKVISAGLAGSDDRYLQQMYDAGAGGNFDLVGVHAYTQGRSPYYEDPQNPGSTFGGLANMKATMDRNGDSAKKIWVTESGWQTSTSGYHVTQDQQAQYVYEAYQRILAEFPYVETLFIYNIRNNGTDPASTTDNYGLLNRDYSQKPAYAAYSAAARGFEPTGTITASPTSVLYGRATTLSGTFVPARQTEVRIEQRPVGSGSWQSVTTTSTNASGSYSVGVVPTMTTEYRAVFPADNVASNSTTVGVKPLPSIRGSRSVTRRASRVTVSGAVAQIGASRVMLQQKVGKRWRNVRWLGTNSASRYAISLRFGRRGYYYYRTTFYGNSRNLPATSGTLRIRVR